MGARAILFLSRILESTLKEPWMATVYVGNIGYATTEDDLLAVFFAG